MSFKDAYRNRRKTVQTKHHEMLPQDQVAPYLEPFFPPPATPETIEQARAVFDNLMLIRDKLRLSLRLLEVTASKYAPRPRELDRLRAALNAATKELLYQLPSEPCPKCQGSEERKYCRPCKGCGYLTHGAPKPAAPPANPAPAGPAR